MAKGDESSPAPFQPHVRLGVAKAAPGAFDAKASEVVGAQRRPHVVVAAALGAKSTESPSVHLAALASKLALLPGVHDIVLYVQEKAAGVCAALV